MEADTSTASNEIAEDAEALLEEVGSFLRRNFPQIAMHGGNAAIQDLDPESGEVWIQLSGACGGCDVSPLTTQAIRSRLPMDIAGISEAHIDTV